MSQLLRTLRVSFPFVVSSFFLRRVSHAFLGFGKEGGVYAEDKKSSRRGESLGFTIVQGVIARGRR